MGFIMTFQMCVIVLCLYFLTTVFVNTYVYVYIYIHEYTYVCIYIAYE